MSMYPISFSARSALILLILISTVFVASGCSQESNTNLVEVGNDKSIGTFDLPDTIQSSAISPDNLSAYITIENEQGWVRREPMTISNNTVRFTTNIAPGTYSFTIEFEYNDAQFREIKLATAIQSEITISSGTNTNVGFQTGDYFYPDEDADGVYNIVELEQGYDPTDGNNTPPLICESETGNINCATLHSISGTVNGLSGGGLVLQNNGSDDLPIEITPEGTFTFPTRIPSGSDYSVTVIGQPTNLSQTCSVVNGSGTVSGADIVEVTVNCVTNKFLISGTISNLQGRDLFILLYENGAQKTMAGPLPGETYFEFTIKVTDGNSYEVGIYNQPIIPYQNCVVINGGGIVNGADVTDIDIDCADPDTVPPAVTDGNLRYSSATLDGVTITWPAASDNVSPGSALEYRLYYSQLDNLQTRSDILSNGTMYGPPGNIFSATITNMPDVFDVYWNVLVIDEARNASVFQPSKVGGVLDPRFNGGGYFTHDGAASGGTGYDISRSITVDALGNVLVAGNSWNGTNYDMVIWRYTKNISGNWQLDPTFPTSGGTASGYIVHDGATGAGSWDFGNSITLDSNGDILVTGYSDSANSGDADMVIWRYTEDTSGNWALDSSFNGVGYITHHNAAGGNRWDEGRDITMDSSGNILVTGRSSNGSTYKMVLWRYTNVSGSWQLDNTFGDDDPANADPAVKLGYFVGETGYQGHSLTIDSTGNILITGESFGSDWDMIVWRYAQDGNGNWALDTAFNGVGYISPDMGSYEFGKSIALDPSGNILVTGYSQAASNEMIIWRIAEDANGNWGLDPNFPIADGTSAGYVTHDGAAGGSGSRGHSITIDDMGRILVTGYSHSGSSYDMAVWRYTNNAANDWFLDPTFNGTGYVTHDNAAGGSQTDQGDGITLDADGSIFVTGGSFNGTDFDMAIWRILAP